jgi:protein ImuB
MLNVECSTSFSSRPARPLCLKPRPAAIDVVAVFPGGPPLRFRWQGRDFQVLRHWGPERIETGWWRGPTVRRDYYRVETTAGPRFWIFRQNQRADWFLHGAFE